MPSALSRELSPAQQRALYIAVVAVLAAAGIWWSIGGRGGDEEPQAAPSASPETAPSIGADQVQEWFPWTPEEFAAAGQAGAGFAEQLATVDPEAEEFADYRARVAERTVSGYEGVLSDEEGGDYGLWRPLASRGGAWQGRSGVIEVTYFDHSTVHLRVSVASHPVSGDADPVEFGTYAVTMRHQDDDTWRVERAQST